MTDRERFEAWWDRAWAGTNEGRIVAWTAWQAAIQAQPTAEPVGVIGEECHQPIPRRIRNWRVFSIRFAHSETLTFAFSTPARARHCSRAAVRCRSIVARTSGAAFP